MSSYFHTQADLERAIKTLVRRDPRLRPVLAVTGMPALRRRESGFSGLAQIIVGQQVSTASAAAIWGRVRGAFEPFHHAAVRRATATKLGNLGLSAAKIRTLHVIADEIQSGRLDLEALRQLDADEAHRTLTALPGVGPWTADVYLLFCLGHSDHTRIDRARGAVATTARRRGAPVVGVLSSCSNQTAPVGYNAYGSVTRDVISPRWRTVRWLRCITAPRPAQSVFDDALRS